MFSSIKERIFLVGCPRSGTTLLQSMIATHEDIVSFPESKLFLGLSTPGSRRSKYGIASSNARLRFEGFLQDIHRSELRKLLPRYAVFVKQYAKTFIEVLDLLAIEQGKSCWLEKTPQHLKRIELIEELVQNAKFIHIVRNGEDVVASLYQVTHKFPELWGGAKNIDQCINEWVMAAMISRLHASKANHVLIDYDELINKPKLLLEQIFKFISVNPENSRFDKQAVIAKSLIKDNESWKGGVINAIRKPKSRKFDEVFNLNQRKYITEKLKELDLNNLLNNYSEYRRVEFR